MTCVIIAAATLLCSSPAPGGVRSPAADTRPTLVVVIIVDQLPAGKLEEIGGRLTGGFRRFLDLGRRFTRCAHAHACTETGPGHATLMSGLFPGHNGIVSNDWYDREAGHDVYCVGDDDTGAARNYDLAGAASADHLRGENLADLIKRVNPASRVYAVAGKDRSAVLTAGHHPDGAFWYSLRTGGFTSNPRIVPRLPAWGADFWGPEPTSTDLYRKHVPHAWIYPQRSDWGQDDNAYESPEFSRVAPHPLMEFDTSGIKPEERVPAIARHLFASPWVDWLSLQLARRVIEEAGLGSDDAPDLLVVSLSGVDAVGHNYGPRSQEYLDALIRIDGWLVDLMNEAQRRGRALFVLTADHGVLPLPEMVPGGRRVDDAGLAERLGKALASRLAKEGDGPFISSIHCGNIYLDRRTLERLHIPLDLAVKAADRELSTWKEVARVYRGAALSVPFKSRAPAARDPFLDLYRASYDPSRSGDLVIQPCEKCLLSSLPYGTSHGTPYDYDRDVPMILLGPGLTPGEDAVECRTVDLAPTVAELLGLTFGTPRDGKPLLESRAVDRAAPRK